MRRILSLFLILVFVLSMVGCSSGESSEQAAGNALKAIKQMDKETLSKYLDVDDLIEDDRNSNDSDGLSEDEIKVVFENLEYKINSSREEGNTAIVNTDITNIDMGIVFGELLKESINLAFSNAFSSNSMTDEEMDTKMTEMMLNLIDKNKGNTITNNVDIKLNKVEKGWKIDIDDELQNALMGNLLNTVGKLEDSFNSFGETEVEPEIQADANIIKKGLNDDVEFATILFKATGVEEVTILTPEYGDSINAEEGTKFIVVDVEVTNLTKEEIMFEAGLVLVDNEDRSFSPYDDAMWYVDDNINYRDLAPSIKEKGKIVYLVPSTAVNYFITAGKAGTNDVFEIVLK